MGEERFLVLTPVYVRRDSTGEVKIGCSGKSSTREVSKGVRSGLEMRCSILTTVTFLFRRGGEFDDCVS